jgi:hypothetical protein
VLSDSARQHGMIYLYRSAPNVYQNSALARYLKDQVYGGASTVDLFQWPLIFGAIALLGQLPLSIPKDIRRRKQMKYGRRLKGPIQNQLFDRDVRDLSEPFAPKRAALLYRQP